MNICGVRFFFSLNLGEKFKLRRTVGRWCASHEIMAHRSHSRIRRLSKHGLEISLASEGTRLGSLELFLLGERLCQDIRCKKEIYCRADIFTVIEPTKTYTHIAQLFIDSCTSHRCTGS